VVRLHLYSVTWYRYIGCGGIFVSGGLGFAISINSSQLN
jgi:hypothetical protein